uniref:Inositol oxygenase n=1 Tax=Sinocyclocheilus grahami TaxID=75366 RepID=A0A672PK55_SINGR
MSVVNLGPDPSLAYRTECHEKDESEFRNFESGALFDRVFNTYKLMHTYQTLDFVKQKLIVHIYIWSNVKIQLNFLSFFPSPDWFQLVGLIHDIGKIMALHGESQWAVDGDTFPVGYNPDGKNPTLNTEFGIYEPQCGLDNVLMSWGHDEYLYRVMKFNKCTIPEEGLYMIRFHSYPWHSKGDYMHLCSEKDLQMLPWVREFNKFDLYTKSTELPDVERLRPYYQSLIDKYCPVILHW